MTVSFAPRWCSCDHGDGHDHLAGSWCVRADTAGAGAAVSLVPTPLVARPTPALAASSHTVRTAYAGPRCPYGCFDPDGQRAANCRHSAVRRDPTIPLNDGFGRIGRFTY